MAYEWPKHQHHGTLWLLLPKGAPDFAMDRIASVFWLSSSKRFHGNYEYAHSTGGPQFGTVQCGSTLQARRWIEARLAQFWEPPKIINPRLTPHPGQVGCQLGVQNLGSIDIAPRPTVPTVTLQPKLDFQIPTRAGFPTPAPHSNTRSD